jgi:hypothetical protein
MAWGGGEPPVGAADQPPAALVHGPVMGPAEQGQVREIRGAAVGPVPQMMGVAPGQGPITTREDTSPVPDRQGAALGRLDDPGNPADLQGLAGGAAQGRGKLGGRGPQPLLKPCPLTRVPGRRRRLGAGIGATAGLAAAPGPWPWG